MLRSVQVHLTSGLKNGVPRFICTFVVEAVWGDLAYSYTNQLSEM